MSRKTGVMADAHRVGRRRRDPRGVTPTQDGVDLRQSSLIGAISVLFFNPEIDLDRRLVWQIHEARWVGIRHSHKSHGWSSSWESSFRPEGPLVPLDLFENPVVFLGPVFRTQLTIMRLSMVRLWDEPVVQSQAGDVSGSRPDRASQASNRGRGPPRRSRSIIGTKIPRCNRLPRGPTKHCAFQRNNSSDTVDVARGFTSTSAWALVSDASLLVARW